MKQTITFNKKTGTLTRGELVLENRKAVLLSTLNGYRIIKKNKDTKILKGHLA